MVLVHLKSVSKNRTEHRNDGGASVAMVTASLPPLVAMVTASLPPLGCHGCRVPVAMKGWGRADSGH